MPLRVTLRTIDGDICHVNTGPILQNIAVRWSYIVRQRNRWSGERQSRKNVAERAMDALSVFGIRTTHLKKFAKAGIVEVSIPFRREEEGWEARILPWEYMLSAATKKYRGDQPMPVVRHLSCRHRGGRTRTPDILAILEAAPGRLREQFEFASENSLIRASLQELKSITIADPTGEQLESKLKELAPDVVHITGVDTHLAARILKQDNQAIHDGIYLSGPNEMESFDAVQLSPLLNAGDPAPMFVGFNCWDSGARLAPLAVAGGARAAIGFQHTFDDSVAELFFVNFYRAWHEGNWDPLAAFLLAWEAISPYRERIRGSGIVLWSARTLIDRSTAYQGMRASREGLQQARATIKESERKVEQEMRPAEPTLDHIRDLIDIDVELFDQLNYALLHNRRSLLKRLVFRLNPKGERIGAPIGVVRDIEVEVLLNVGADSFPYRTKLTIDHTHPRIDLADPKSKPLHSHVPPGGIRVPLTSELARSVDERVQTSLFIDVRWHGQILYRHTHSVYLAPVDEWRLDDQDIVWLPSFVQPRDPAVAKIINAAQRYLMCLADYPGAGFDGYQSFNPDAAGIEAWMGVDDQVRAIWSALIFDYGLKYINPPPAYSEKSQRLRTPSQTMGQDRGTCVDLAILMASCLEWLEIHPVIFMLNDHAFPGYWRSLEGYDKFCGVYSDETLDESEIHDEPTATSDQTPAWISDRSAYHELKNHVDAGNLVPMETIDLTVPCGFTDAVADGMQYFQNVRNRSFHSMVDIVTARKLVTPLPIFFAE